MSANNGYFKNCSLIESMFFHPTMVAILRILSIVHYQKETWCGVPEVTRCPGAVLINIMREAEVLTVQMEDNGGRMNHGLCMDFHGTYLCVLFSYLLHI